MRNVGSSSGANLSRSVSSRAAVTRGRFKNHIGRRQQSQGRLGQRGGKGKRFTLMASHTTSFTPSAVLSCMGGGRESEAEWRGG